MTIMSRQALFDAAWQRPLTEMAEELGVTSTGLKKICDRHEIPTPGRGYWAQVRAGKTFPRPKLRPVSEARLEDVRIVGARTLSPAVTAAVAASRALAVKRKGRPQRSPASLETPPSPDSAPSNLLPSDAYLERADLTASVRALSRGRLDGDGFTSVSGRGVIPMRVAPDAHRSALSFLAALAVAAEVRGWRLQRKEDRTVFDVQGEPIAFRLDEQPTKTLHEPTTKELKLKQDYDRWGSDSQPWRTWDLSPSGRLALVIEENPYSGLRRTFSQRVGRAFEDSLDVILTGLAAHAAFKVEQRREAEARAQAAAKAEARRRRLEAFDKREGRRLEFADAIATALAERAKLTSVLAHLEFSPDIGRNPPGMESWLRRRVTALDARLDPTALEISARHNQVDFQEPPPTTEGPRWYTPPVTLHLWIPAGEAGRVNSASELDWAVVQGLIGDPGALAIESHDDV